MQERLEADVIDVAVQKEIVAEADRLDVKDKAVLVLCELMFKDPLKVQSMIKNNRTIFLRVSFNYIVLLLYNY